MTILHGEHYQVETIDQLLEIARLDYYDVAEALVGESNDLPDNFVDQSNELHEGEADWVPADEIRDLPEDEIKEWVNGYVYDETAITSVLEDDYRDWIHLFDGHVHEVVEVHQ